MQCSQCHAENRKVRRFCAEAASAPESKFGSPNLYTPKHLVEKILQSKSAPEGERKQVTALKI